MRVSINKAGTYLISADIYGFVSICFYAVCYPDNIDAAEESFQSKNLIIYPKKLIFSQSSSAVFIAGFARGIFLPFLTNSGTSFSATSM